MKKNLSVFVMLFSLITLNVNAQCCYCNGNGLINGKRNAPVKMILDSDFGSSTDDLFALMMLHHYIDEGLVDLQGIVVENIALFQNLFI